MMIADPADLPFTGMRLQFPPFPCLNRTRGRFLVRLRSAVNGRASRGYCEPLTGESGQQHIIALAGERGAPVRVMCP
jgi:hypothetical protein